MSYQHFFSPLNSPELFLFMFVRVVLGILFFFQAYHKIFKLKLKYVYIEVSEGCLEKGIPLIFSRLSVYGSSFIELVAGAFLILGLFTPFVLYLLGFHMILVVLAFSFLDGLWDMKHVFPRLILLIFLFILPVSWNVISFDYLIDIIFN